MCTRSVDRTCALLIAAALAAFAVPELARAQGFPTMFDVGTPASPQDIAAVAIAIAPDGKGLPAGKGDYAAGKRVYETACAACHGANLQGVAGLPNMPAGAALRLIGGRGTLTTKNPVMTVESYWPYATTLFDDVRRAMPFPAPGSLTADRSTRCWPTSWPRASSSTRRRCSTPRRFRAFRCPTATASFPIRGLNGSSSVRRVFPASRT